MALALTEGTVSLSSVPSLCGKGKDISKLGHSLICILSGSTGDSDILSETESILTEVTSVGILLAEVPEEQSLVLSLEVPKSEIKSALL